MKKTLALMIIFMTVFLLFLSLTSHTSVWENTYGSLDTFDSAFSMVQTSDGGYALAGVYDSLGVSDGIGDFWMVKTNENGNIQWNKTYGGAHKEEAHCVVQTSDGGYALAGYTQLSGAYSSVWLVKTDSAGNMQWNRTYGGASSDLSFSMVQTSDGGYALAGATASFGAGNYDFWLVKTDHVGNMQWNKTYGGTNRDQAYSVVETSDRGYAVAGSTHSFGAGKSDSWLIKVDSEGNMYWDKTYGGEGYDDVSSMVQTSDGGYAMAGSTESSGAEDFDFWLIKTNSTGHMQWSKTYGGTDREIGHSVVQTADGGYAIAGQTRDISGHFDVLLIKTDSSGNQERNQTYEGKGFDFVSSVVQASDGGYTIAGYTSPFDAQNKDFWLIKTDAGLGAVSTPFWSQWWFWVIYGGVPSVFAGWYIIRPRRDYVLRGFRKIFSSNVPRRDLEKMVFDYIEKHEGKIRISECAKELGITELKVKEIISRLQEKGHVKM